MHVKLFFVTFNLKCRLHAVSVAKPSEPMSKFWNGLVFKTKSKPIFGFSHIPTRHPHCEIQLQPLHICNCSCICLIHCITTSINIQQKYSELYKKFHGNERIKKLTVYTVIVNGRLLSTRHVFRHIQHFANGFKSHLCYIKTQPLQYLHHIWATVYIWQYCDNAAQCSQVHKFHCTVLFSFKLATRISGNRIQSNHTSHLFSWPMQDRNALATFIIMATLYTQFINIRPHITETACHRKGPPLSRGSDRVTSTGQCQFSRCVLCLFAMMDLCYGSPLQQRTRIRTTSRHPYAHCFYPFQSQLKESEQIPLVLDITDHPTQTTDKCTL